MICKKNNCTGCGLCSKVCPQKAIEMVKNSYDGFLYPKIDKSKCINCNICENICHNNSKTSTVNVNKAYAVQLKDKEKLLYSASGGAFAGLAAEILKKKGYVYGVSDRKGKLEYIKVSKENDLKYLLGSKYYQCEITSNDYESIENDSKNNIVLVSGTPCQISAMKKNNNINQNNLITVEILCQGVPSDKVIKYFYSEKEKKNNSLIKEHYFRSKDKNVGRNYLNKYIYENGKIEYYIGEEDDLSLTFQRQIFLRESCYNCKYSNPQRVADFTIGDLWNYDSVQNNANINKELGVSILLCNTEIAEEIFKNNTTLNFNIVNKEECLESNLPYHQSCKRPFARNFSYFLMNLNMPPKYITYVCCTKYYIKKIIKKVLKSNNN